MISKRRLPATKPSCSRVRRKRPPNPQQALYGAFEVKHMFYTTLYFLYSSFFVRLGIPFLRPDPHVLRPTRTGPVKVGRRSALAARSVVSRPRLDRPEHGGHAGCSRDDDQRGALPSGAKLLGGGPILETGFKTMACFG